MRIIAGKYKGRILNILKSEDVRPTTDRVREAMFSSINSIYGNIEGTCVLDAFAGSGALGFESISRGSTHLVAFEINKKTHSKLVENSQMFLDVQHSMEIICGDVKKSRFDYVAKDKKFDILFFDPPYVNDAKDVLDILKSLSNLNKINNGALVVYEHSAKTDFQNYIDMFNQENFIYNSGKIYGDIAIEYLKFS